VAAIGGDGMRKALIQDLPYQKMCMKVYNRRSAAHHSLLRMPVGFPQRLYPATFFQGYRACAGGSASGQRATSVNLMPLCKRPATELQWPCGGDGAMKRGRFSEEQIVAVLSEHDH